MFRYPRYLKVLQPRHSFDRLLEEKINNLILMFFAIQWG